MAVRTYYRQDGEILSEDSDGSVLDFLTDALGSITATVDQTSTIQSRARYKPFGDLLSGSSLRMAWVGSRGYRPSGLAYSNYYMTYRHYGTKQGQWTTQDPIWPVERAFAYAGSSPTVLTDPSGMSIGALACAGACTLCAGCAVGIWVACQDWYPGYSSFAACATDFINSLPPLSQIGCAAGTAGCIACLASLVPRPKPTPKPLPSPGPKPLPPTGPQPRPVPPKRRPVPPDRTPVPPDRTPVPPDRTPTPKSPCPEPQAPPNWDVLVCTVCVYGCLFINYSPPDPVGFSKCVIDNCQVPCFGT